MTLEQLSYLAEIIGVVLIVVSLVYVAQQLRQNTEMARVASADQGVQRDFDIVSPLLESKELAEAWVIGESDFEKLDAADQSRLIFFERRALVWWHHCYQLRQKGLYSDADWQSTVGIIRAVGHRQALRASWDAFRDSFETAFVDFVEEQFAMADGNVAA